MIAQPRPGTRQRTPPDEPCRRSDGRIPCRGRSRGAFVVECRICAYEPDDQSSLPAMRCPKCHGTAWRRLPRPGWLLVAAGADWPEDLATQASADLPDLAAEVSRGRAAPPDGSGDRS